jgi:hypothetical protein
MILDGVTLPFRRATAFNDDDFWFKDSLKNAFYHTKKQVSAKAKSANLMTKKLIKAIQMMISIAVLAVKVSV